MHIIQPGFEYFERAPHASLSRLVACFRTIRAAPEVVSLRPVMRTLPDGCSELVCTMTPGILDYPPGAVPRMKPQFFFMGPLEQVRLAVARQGIDGVSILFRPGAFSFFQSGHGIEFVEKVVDANEIVPKDSNGFLERAMVARSAAERIDWTERFVLWWATRGERTVDAVIEAAVSMLERSNGEMRMDTLAHKVGYSRRQFERRFLAAVGMTPKAFARTLRFNRALRHLCLDTSEKPQLHFLDGFFDQSHLVREFQKFSGLSPTSLAQEFSKALLVRGLSASAQAVGQYRAVASEGPSAGPPVRAAGG